MTSKSALTNDSILIVAAEASSCMYAKNFIREWQKLYPKDHFFGVGDREMESLGVQCFGYAEEMAVVGLVEVFKHWNTISGCFRDIEKEVRRSRPKFALLLDYPGFNLRLAKSLKTRGVPVVYYISPQLWAWKKGRVRQIQDSVDEMLVVFPFEVDFYKKYGVEASFVGHPLVEVVEEEAQSFEAVQEATGKTLGLMPGSRKSEIQFNLKTQLLTAKTLKETCADLEIKILLAPTLSREDLQPIVDQVGVSVDFLEGKPTEMIMGCDVILTASGTATLQVALCEKPMVVMYRMNPVTAFLAKILVNTVDYFCIVNLIANKEIVPEFFQDRANPKELSQVLRKILEDSHYRQTMLDQLQEVKKQLGRGGATHNVIGFLKDRFSC